MASIHTFILPIENPEAVENCRHSGNSGRAVETIVHRLAVIERDAGKGPNIRTARRSVNPIPAMDEEFAAGAGRGVRPGCCALWVTSGSGVKGINLRQP